MSRREECLITNYSEAIEWLERYRHTITDSKVLEVIEQLETEEREDLDATANNLETLQDKYDALFTHNKEVETELKEIKSGLINIIGSLNSMVSE